MQTEMEEMLPPKLTKNQKNFIFKKEDVLVDLKLMPVWIRKIVQNAYE